MIKSLARRAFHTSGAVRAVRWFHRKRMRILMYHRFSDRDALVTQCAHIRANYQPVSLTQAADWLLCGGGWPDNAIVVTVDDGYRDFYEVAYPVFREYGIPAVVGVPDATKRITTGQRVTVDGSAGTIFLE